MAANYPGSVYSPRTKENKAGEVYNAAKKTIVFSEDVVKLDEEVVAVENELGLNPKGTSASVMEKIKGIRSLSDIINVLLAIGDAASGLTNYVRIKLNGQLQFYGTARIINHVIMPVQRFKLAGIKDPSWGNEGVFITLDFVHNAVKEAFAQGYIPFRWDSDTDVTILIDWLCDNDARGGDVVWAIEYLARKDDEEVGAAGVTISQAFTGANAGLLQRNIFTTKILKGNIEADDIIGIRVYRDTDDAGDTLVETARFVSLHLHFTRNKIGQPL